MPIELICQGCSAKLRVAEEHAGKQARCPKCRRVCNVPMVAEPEEDDQELKLAPLEGQSQSQQTAAAGWTLRTPDGRTYGPVGRSELDSWLKEGRITAECQLQQEGTLPWHPAAHIYPSLAPAQSSAATGANPFADVQPTAANPYQMSAVAPMRRSYGSPHRGGMILALGILGWLVCAIFAPFAWAMGNADLKEMRAGRMDPSGIGLTQGGMILGMIQTILLLIGCGFVGLLILAGA